MRVEKALKDLPFIADASVNYAGGKAIVSIEDERRQKQGNGEQLSGDLLQDVSQAVERAGYKLGKKQEEQRDEKLESLKKRLIISWALTLPLMVRMLLSMVWNIEVLPAGWPAWSAVIPGLVLAFPVIFLIGYPVLKSTLISFRMMSFTMDSLIGIGTVASYATGVLALAGMEVVSFASVGAMIMAIYYIGEYLKAAAGGKANRAVRGLLELGAKEARLLDESGQSRLVPVQELVPGNSVQVRPGEKVPVDGQIVTGSTSIDESWVTGEPVPAERGPGSRVIGGTVNQNGSIVVRVEAAGDEGFLAQIARMTEEAGASRVPVQDLADRITRIFVPAVLLISAASLLFWLLAPEIGAVFTTAGAQVLPWVSTGLDPVSRAVAVAVSVLVIACPCALGLATPTALMVGLGRGASSGIFFRNGEAIQRARGATAVFFDKTGTITRGRPEVHAAVPVGGVDREEFLRTAYAVERVSEHPLAAAVTAWLEDNMLSSGSGLEVSDVEAVPGRGIQARLDNEHMVYIGSPAFLEEKGIPVQDLQREAASYLDQGMTIAAVGLLEHAEQVPEEAAGRPEGARGQVFGFFALSDPVKSGVDKQIAYLRDLGLSTVMLTGDNEAAAAYAGTQVGVDRIRAGLLPGDKTDVIRRFQQEGERVIMVGDGINDAPALKQADVGIAVGTGTDIAIEAADITLVSRSLAGVAQAVGLSRYTFRKIRANLFWAFLYNVIAIPIAVLGFLHPAVAETAMALSSVSVVLNSLSLRGLLDRKIF